MMDKPIKITILKENKTPMFEMSKLTARNADKSICGDFGTMIYFSEVQAGHEPRIKFDGGTKETNSTQTAPTLKFDNMGKCEVELQSWMNKKNCPNGFDGKCISKVTYFVNRFLSLLLLVWFRKLDESDMLLYFQGHLSLQTVFERAEEENIRKLYPFKSMQELHSICLKNNYYSF